MEFSTFSGVLSFEVRSRDLPGPGRFNSLVGEAFEDVRRRLDVFADPLKVIPVIRDDAHEASRLERPMHVPQERLLDEPALLMPFFRPRVGEIDVDLAETPRGHEVPKEDPGFRVDDPDIGQAAPAAAVRRIAPEGARHFDPDEIHLRSARRLLDQERAFSGPDLQFQGSRIGPLRSSEPGPGIHGPGLQGAQVRAIDPDVPDIQGSATSEGEGHGGGGVEWWSIGVMEYWSGRILRW